MTKLCLINQQMTFVSLGKDDFTSNTKAIIKSNEGKNNHYTA
jgi:hypothetical protein